MNSQICVMHWTLYFQLRTRRALLFFSCYNVEKQKSADSFDSKPIKDQTGVNATNFIQRQRPSYFEQAQSQQI